MLSGRPCRVPSAAHACQMACRGAYRQRPALTGIVLGVVLQLVTQNSLCLESAWHCMVQCLCLQTTDWHQVTVKELPEQHDGGSCGVFTCMYAKYLVAGSNPTQAFSQYDIPRLRLQMAADLLKAYGLPNANLPADSSGMHLTVIDQLHKSQQAFVQCPANEDRELTARCHPCNIGHAKLKCIGYIGSCRGLASLLVLCKFINGEFEGNLSKLNPFQTASILISTDDPALRVDRLSGPTLHVLPSVLPIQKTATAANMNPEMMKLAMEQMVNRTPAVKSPSALTMKRLTQCLVFVVKDVAGAGRRRLYAVGHSLPACSQSGSCILLLTILYAADGRHAKDYGQPDSSANASLSTTGCQPQPR